MLESGSGETSKANTKNVGGGVGSAFSFTSAAISGKRSHFLVRIQKNSVCRIEIFRRWECSLSVAFGTTSHRYLALGQ